MRLLPETRVVGVCVFSGALGWRAGSGGGRSVVGRGGVGGSYIPNIRHSRLKAGPFVSEELTSCRSH